MNAETEQEIIIKPLPENKSLNLIGSYSRYLALLAAWIATSGSLYMSEALGWVPCLLCWYQRILMYPLALIITVGILTCDRRMYSYVLALSVPGIFVSSYHYLYQKTDIFRGMVPCTIGVPCSSDYLNWLGGLVTIPFLALIAFIIITFSAVASRLATNICEIDEMDEQLAHVATPGSRRMLRVWSVFIIIAAVVMAFVIAGVSYKHGIANAAINTPTLTMPLPTLDSVAVARSEVP